MKKTFINRIAAAGLLCSLVLTVGATGLMPSKASALTLDLPILAPVVLPVDVPTTSPVTNILPNATVILPVGALDNVLSKIPLIDLKTNAVAGQLAQSLVNLGVNTTNPTNVDLQVPYRITGSTGNLVQNITPATGIITIKAGERGAVVPLTILNNAGLSELENAVVNLYQPLNATLSSIADLSFTLADASIVGLTLNPTCLTVLEGGADAKYQVALNTKPTGPVVLTVQPDTQLKINPTVITFTPDNFNIPQTISVQALQDAVLQGPHNGSIHYLLASADLRFDKLNVGEQNLAILDQGTQGGLVGLNGCETAGVIISKTAVTVKDNGADDTYTIVLKSQPAKDVDVTIAPKDGEVTVDPVKVTFHDYDWNIPKLVTVSAVHDAASKTDRTDVISHTVKSSDPYYNNIAAADVAATVNPATTGDNGGDNGGGGNGGGGSGGGSTGGGSGGGSSGGGSSGGSGGSGSGALPERAPVDAMNDRCLDYNPARPLTFVDFNEANKNYQRYITVLKNTFENKAGQYVLSGYADANTLDLPVSNDNGELARAFVGPNNNIIRLELAKVLMISHCYPIMDATTLKKTVAGQTITEWKDLPKTHTGNSTHDYIVDVAYSGKYWRVWDGYKDNTIRITDQVSIAESVKMLIRIGQLVRGTSFTQDSTTGNWWDNFFAASKSEGTAIPLRTPARALEFLQRGEGITELVKALLIREMYMESAETQVKRVLEMK